MRLLPIVLLLSVVAPVAEAEAADLVEWSETFTLADPARSTVVIQNRGLGAIELEPLALNGHPVLHSLADVHLGIAAVPPQPPDDTLALRVFRYVTENRRHWYPLTLNFEWLMAPTLFFNSTGVAACGETQGLLETLATSLGLPARRMGLGTHVVAEIYENGRWKMFDADYGVYFLNRQGQVASLAELEVDLTLIKNPVLRLPVLDPLWDPYTTTYANRFKPPNGPVGQLVPVPPPPRAVRFALPRGASLRLPARAAPGPPDMVGEPLHDYRNLVLRLPAGVTGDIANPLIVHTVRGAGQLEIDGISHEIGSPGLAATIDARAGALETFRIVESRGPIEILYLLNPLRWQLFVANELVARATPSAALDARGVAVGAAGSDTDGDGVGDDAGANGIAGDQPCAGVPGGCDDNCVAWPNPAQRDADGDGRGNGCDGDLDGNELLTDADRFALDTCRMGGAPAADPDCLESDLDASGVVDAADAARFVELASAAGGLAADPPPPPTVACGLGPELAPLLLALGAVAAARRRTGSPQRAGPASGRRARSADSRSGARPSA